MPAETLTTRYEIKMTFDAVMLEELRSWVHIHPSAFSIAYPPRWVNSIYLDTHDLDTFNDHLASVPIRRKLRFRWYGENLYRAKGQVEVKNKSERAGWKIIESVDQEFDLETMDWAEIMDGLRAGTTGIIHELLCVAHPVILTVYFREYYVSADGLIRLTLDSDIRAYEEMFTARPNLWFKQPVEQKMVLELKSNVENATQVADVLAHFPARSERHSKYVTNLNLALVK